MRKSKLTREGGGQMKIHGFQSLTLLDYPGKVACTVFLGGCNFRCPFCQNTGLVLAPEREAVVPMEEVMGVLRKRRGMLDGVHYRRGAYIDF